MSVQQWRFSALEFALLWELAGREILPYPLQFRPDVAEQDDYTRQRMAAASAIQPQLDQMLHRALFVLAVPEVRVQVCGFSGERQDTKIRVHAGIQRDVGAVAVQAPGRDHDRGGDVLLSLCGARTIASRVIESLPSAPAARGEGLHVYRRDLEQSSSLTIMESPRDRSAREQMSNFLDRRRTCIGHIAVHPGPARDATPTDDGHDFHWMDFDGDGRYLTRGGDTLTATPADAAGMTTELQRLISRTVRTAGV